MIRLAIVLAFVALPIFLSGQLIEVDGTIKLGTVSKNNDADSVVVRLADGTLGIREVSTIDTSQQIAMSGDTLSLDRGGGDVVLRNAIIHYFITLPSGLEVLINAGESISNLIDAGASVDSLLKEGISVADLLNAGASVNSLVNAGASTSDLLAAGATVESMINAGVSVSELLSAGASVESLLSAGVSISDLINAGTPADSLLNAGAEVLMVMAELSWTVDSMLVYFSPVAVFNYGLPADSLYGKTYQEGIIFYLDTLNEHIFEGMVVTPNAITGTSSWGCLMESVPGAQNDSIGDGQLNTTAIIDSSCMVQGAADIADAYDSGEFDDWFLPSKEDLKAMHDNLHLNGKGGFDEFGGGSYWSSSEEDVNNAWAHEFLTVLNFSGTQYSTGKQFGWRVRGVRFFGP